MHVDLKMGFSFTFTYIAKKIVPIIFVWNWLYENIVHTKINQIMVCMLSLSKMQLVTIVICCHLHISACPNPV